MKCKLFFGSILALFCATTLIACANGNDNSSSSIKAMPLPGGDGTNIIDPISDYASYDDQPFVDDVNNRIIYGMYPQTLVKDEELINLLNNNAVKMENGTYSFLHEYYARKKGKRSTQYIDGSKCESGKYYWFRCEPIYWKILSKSNNKYFVVSEKILDARKYFDFAGTRIITGGIRIQGNNYAASDIRAFLNGYDASDISCGNYSSNNSFLSMAFYNNDSYIETTKVYNDVSTTGYKENSNVCENTEDKIFLLSYQDYTNKKYGFTSDESRKCQTTDYAVCCGALNSNQNNSFYWTRSPLSPNQNEVSTIYNAGYISNFVVSNPYIGVRPAMNIDLSSLSKTIYSK